MGESPWRRASKALVWVPGLGTGTGIFCSISQSVQRNIGMTGSRHSFQIWYLWVFSWWEPEGGRGGRESPQLGACRPSGQFPDATLSQMDRRAWEDTLSLTIQPSNARNCQKVKIPFVNKIELFDCETRVHGILNNLI